MPSAKINLSSLLGFSQLFCHRSRELVSNESLQDDLNHWICIEMVFGAMGMLLRYIFMGASSATVIQKWPVLIITCSASALLCPAVFFWILLLFSSLHVTGFPWKPSSSIVFFAYFMPPPHNKWWKWVIWPSFSTQNFYTRISLEV